MAKKSLSTKRSLKSLFSKSEANLEESAGNDGSGGDGGKTLKLLKWKKKKKTEPEADKTEERTVSQNELDGSGTALDGDGVNWSNGGDRKKLSIYGTAPRSKKGSLSYSETDLRKPRKFGTFSFGWKKKGKQRATDFSQSTMGLDTPQELEEEQEDDLEGSVENPENPPRDPVHGTERRVRFEFSEPEPPGPQVALSPPSGPTDQSKLREAMTNSPDVPDGGMAQGSAPSAPDALWQASGTVPSRVIGQEWQEVQVNGPDEPAPLSSVHKEGQVSATSAAIAALTRAQSLHHGLPTTPPPGPPLSVPAVAVAPVRSPFPKTDLPQANTSLLKDEISEMAAPISALSGPVFSNSDPSTQVSDISIPNSDLSVAVKETDTSLPNIDLPDEVTLPNTVTVVPKSEVYDTVIPDSDTSLRNTRLSDTTAPNIDTPSPKIEVSGTVVPGTDTPLKNTDTVALNTDTSLPYITDLSDTVASKIEVTDTVIPYTDTLLKSTDLSDTNDPTTYTPLPNTDPSVTIGSSLPKNYISNIDTTIPNTVFSDNVVHNTETSSAKSEVWGRAISNTSLVYTDPFRYTDAVSPNVDSSLSKNEISYTVAHDPSLPNTDVVTPNIDTLLRNRDFSTASPNIRSSHFNPEFSDTVAQISDFLNTDFSNSFSPNTDISPPNNSDPGFPNTGRSIVRADTSDIIVPKWDSSLPKADLSEPFGTSGDTFLPSETEVSYVITPNPGVSDPVVTKTGLSPANAETFQPTNFGLSNIEVLDRNGNDPFTKYDSYNSDHTSNSNQPLPEVDLKADWPRPGLSTENLNPFRPKAYDSYERSYERSYPYTLDHNENDILTVGVSDIVNDRQEAGIQEDKVDGDPAAAETGRRGEGGLEQWREDRRRREEREARGILKRAELEDVTVEGQDGEKCPKALKEGGEWGRGLQQEDFGVLGQKEWVKGEVEEVERRPQLPVTEPDSPVPQERAPQESTEDPRPSLTSVNSADQAGRFLDDLSGPWGTVEESVSPQAPEDQDMMNSGYGILNTTLNAKAAQARDVKEDGRLRFQKVSLVSSYGDRSEDRSSSPAELHYDRDRGTTGTVIQRDILSREDRSVPDPSLTSSGSLQRFGSDSPGSLNSFYSAASLDTQHPSSPGAYRQAGFSTLSPEEPGSHGNSHWFGERSETDGPLSGVFTATLVELLPSPTSPDSGSPYDMDTFVDTLRSMDRPQRRVSRPAPLSAVTSLPPIVEDSPVPGPKALNGTAVLPADLGLKWCSPKDLVSPLEMMKRQQEVDGPEQRSRPLPLRASADSSIVFRRTTPGGPSGNGAASPQLNGSSSPGPSRLDGSLLFSSYLQENGKSPSGRTVTRASSLPDTGPSRERISSAPSLPGAEAQAAASSRYERFSFLMSPPSSLAEVPEPARISLPPSLSHNPLGELGFSSMPSSPSDVIRSPTTDPLSKLQRSLSVDSPFASQVLADVQWGSHLSPQPEPVRPAVTKYRAFPDAYLTKEKEHGKLNPRPGKMFIYTDPDLCGERIEVRSDVIDTTSWDLPETVYIRVVRGGWVLYEKPNFKGEKFPLDEGDIELTCPFTSPEEGQEKEGEREVEGEEEVKSKPSRKCVIGSLRRAVRDYSVPEISLFPEENAEGKKVVFRDTSEDARIFGFPVKASSIIIKAGLWLVYAHPFMQGVPRVLEVGGYPNPAAWGVDKPYVGSVHPLKIGEPKVEKPHEPKLVIFDKPYFTGKSRDVYTHLPQALSKWLGAAGWGIQRRTSGGTSTSWRRVTTMTGECGGGCDAELRSIRLIRADFSEPMLVMIAQPEEEEEEEERTFEVTEATPDVELFNFPTSTSSIHVLSGAWIAYSHVDFSGNQYVLEKGFYSNSGDWGATDNRICSLQPILLAPTETPTSRSEVLLYSEPDFQGQCQQCQENQESLPDKFTSKSCRVLRGSWVVYEGREYSGNLYILPEGDYPNLNSMGCPPSCSLRSLKIIPLVFAVPSISLFGLECFEGRQVTLDTEISSLMDEGFNNHVLSIRVNSGCWVACEHTNYRGRQILLEPIEISNWLKFSGLPTIGSMYPVRQKRHFFRIKNQERGHVMSIQGGVEEMKSGRVVVTEQVEGMSDIWYYQDGLIKNKLAPSMCLQVMGEVEPGSKVVLWSETRQPIQVWTTQTSGIIANMTFPGMVLDIKGGKTYDRNHVIIYAESEERPSQQWEIELL
ncbi:hypothetical protein SKAU_G00407320 [Synaphobranchus kaupii]|uniref:Beta/gamma crystallin 'Greek key' domain-containing protein n=1 Tax=Synaphobranchus kaupii TaxID=118154 RepID=A0A9Q1EA94_SYNKA|nr:hypothetical protein SKAU_G00407320 [Synaphobranchus kaupii]